MEELRKTALIRKCVYLKMKCPVFAGTEV